MLDGMTNNLISLAKGILNFSLSTRCILFVLILFSWSKCLPFRVSFPRCCWRKGFQSIKWRCQNLYSYLLRNVCTKCLQAIRFSSLFSVNISSFLCSRGRLVIDVLWWKLKADDVFILSTIFTFWHFNIITESGRRRWKEHSREKIR